VDKITINVDADAVGVLFDGRLLSNGAWIINTETIPVEIADIELNVCIEDRVPFKLPQDTSPSARPLTETGRMDMHLAMVRRAYEHNTRADFEPMEPIGWATKEGDDVQVFTGEGRQSAIRYEHYALFSALDLDWMLRGPNKPMAGFIKDKDASSSPHADVLIMPMRMSQTEALAMVKEIEVRRK
jgi:hypothetical protein